MNTIHSTLCALLLLSTSATSQELAELVASDAQVKENFGNAVAVHGSTIVVGSVNDFIAPDQGRGSAYVYVGADTTWSQQAKLAATDGRAFDWLGSAVAISGDTVVASAPGDDLVDGSNNDEGSVYVFVRSGTSWTQQAKLVPSDAAAGDVFGSAVVIDGDTLAISAPYDDDAGSNAGSVYVYVRMGTTWTQQAKIVASDGSTEDLFGTSLALDGDTLAIGVLRDDDGASNAGSAYVFVRSGTTWSQQGKVTASDAGANESFGRTVAVEDDTLAVGAFQKDHQGIDSGAVYVFTRTGVAWSQQAKLVPSDASALDNFGYAVALSGPVLLVGASQDSPVGPSSGSTYAFTGAGSSWTQIAKFGPAEAAARDFFGVAVALSGGTAVVGATHDDDAGINSGSAHVFAVDSPGVPFCAGDGTLATACPCANAGQTGRGCENSAATGGAYLVATGSASPDTLVLTSSGELPTVLSIFLQGDANNTGGVVFGDGVRCAAGSLKRLYVKNAVAGSVSAPAPGDPSVTTQSAALGDPIAPGSTRYYQVYYRDPNTSFCPAPPGSSFNVSSGIAIVW